MLAIAVRVPDHGQLQPWRLIVIAGVAKSVWLEDLNAIALTRHDEAKALVAVRKLAAPPVAIAVISAPLQNHKVPEWEQRLSAGAVCMNLLCATLALGYGGNWLTGWHAYDERARALLNVGAHERIAGVVMIGSVSTQITDRQRPDLNRITTWLQA